MNWRETVDFTVKWREEYRQKKEKSLIVEELGRHKGGYSVLIETWSKASGDPIPEKCRIPLVNPPRSLPLVLKLGPGLVKDEYFIDVTNQHYNANFKVKIPAKEILPEFISKTFSIGRNLLWATRENIDLSHIKFFIMSGALRTIASCAYFKRSSWSFAVVYYKDRLFISDGKLKDNDKFWLRGHDSPDFRFHKEVHHPSDFITQSDMTTTADKPSNLYCEYPPEDFWNRKLLIYGKKFEDAMKSGGLVETDSLQSYGEDGDVRCVKLLKLGNHTLLTSTRISCQEPQGKVDHQDNYVEIKSRFPSSDEKFAMYQSCKLWTHCALVGVSSVYCGFRDMDSMKTIAEIRKYTMTDLAEIGQKYWKPNDILTFLDTVLCWLKQKLNKNSIRTNRGEEWLKKKLQEEEISTFSLTYNGAGLIHLTPDEFPEFQMMMTQQYDYIDISTKVAQSCDYDVPDSWDDSD